METERKKLTHLLHVQVRIGAACFRYAVDIKFQFTIKETPIGQQFRCVCIFLAVAFNGLSNLFQIRHLVQFDGGKECGRLSEQILIIVMSFVVSHTYFIYCNRNWFIASLPAKQVKSI